MDRNWSVKAKNMQPRISMITAVDKLGNVWICLTMSNSNKSTMGVFMEHLCKKLDRQNPHWRNSTVIQWDGKCRRAVRQHCLDILIILSFF